MKKTTPTIKLPEQFSSLPVFSVSELREHLSSVIKSTFRTPIILRGITASDPSIYPSFVYFDLKDEKENMNFNLSGYIGNYYNIEKKLKAAGVVEKLTKDVPVMLIVEPYVNTQKRITVMFRIIDIIPEYTTSILANAKNITLNKLSEEGLIDLQKKLILPALIKNVGLITSDQGTSVQDIRSGMGDSAKFFNIIFKSVRVEGESAVPSIIDAVNEFNKFATRLSLDVILIARGGGSAVDLAPFDDYELCKTICLSKVPIITAIGHDRDEHAAEFCSHLTPIPSTPSGIGAFLKQQLNDVKQELMLAIQGVTTEIVEIFMKEETLVKTHLSTVLSSIKRFFAVNVEKLRALVDNIVKDSKRFFDYSEDKVLSLQNILEAYDHRSVLQRGYAVVWNDKDKVIKRKKEMTEKANIEFYDGKVEVKGN